MGALGEWIRQVVLVLILTGVVELALPAGAVRRYVQVVLGLLVLLAIIRPVLAWLNSEPADLVPAWQRALEAAAAGAWAGGGSQGGVNDALLEAARDRTRSLALEVHRQRLVALVREEVRAAAGMEPLAIDLDLVADPSSPRWGAVTGVTIHLPGRVVVPAGGSGAVPGGVTAGGNGADPGTGPAAEAPPAGGFSPEAAPGPSIQPVEPVRIGPIGPAGGAAAGAGGARGSGGARTFGGSGATGGSGTAPAAGAEREVLLPAGTRRVLEGRVRQALAARLDLDPTAVRVVWVEAVEGGDAGGTR